jgi:hypothetical protein
MTSTNNLDQKIVAKLRADAVRKIESELKSGRAYAKLYGVSTSFLSHRPVKDSADLYVQDVQDYLYAKGYDLSSGYDHGASSSGYHWQVTRGWKMTKMTRGEG